MKRKKLTGNQKLELFRDHNGICHRCKLKIDAVRGEQWHVGHIIDLACGGKDELANMAPEHRECNLGYAAETGNAMAAKIKRVAKRHLGIKEKSAWSKRYHAMKEWKRERDQ